MSNGLDPDQDQHSVGPDLGLNCLQTLTADNKSCACKNRVKCLQLSPYIDIGALFRHSGWRQSSMRLYWHDIVTFPMIPRICNRIYLYLSAIVYSAASTFHSSRALFAGINCAPPSSIMYDFVGCLIMQPVCCYCLFVAVDCLICLLL